MSIERLSNIEMSNRALLSEINKKMKQLEMVNKDVDAMRSELHTMRRALKGSDDNKPRKRGSSRKRVVSKKTDSVKFSNTGGNVFYEEISDDEMESEAVNETEENEMESSSYRDSSRLRRRRYTQRDIIPGTGRLLKNGALAGNVKLDDGRVAWRIVSKN